MSNIDTTVKALECCKNWDDAGVYDAYVPMDCKNCPRRELQMEASTCHEALLNETIDLLKSMMPRVMDLKELLSRQTAYVEVNTPGQPVLQCTFSFPGGEGISVYPIGTSDGPYVRYADYLKKWRCWTSRPTEEQREATPWNTD